MSGGDAEFIKRRRFLEIVVLGICFEKGFVWTAVGQAVCLFSLWEAVLVFRGQRPFVHGSFSLSFLSLAQSRGSVRGAQGLFQFIVKWEAVHVRHIFTLTCRSRKLVLFPTIFKFHGCGA